MSVLYETISSVVLIPSSYHQLCWSSVVLIPSSFAGMELGGEWLNSNYHHFSNLPTTVETCWNLFMRVGENNVKQLKIIIDWEVKIIIDWEVDWEVKIIIDWEVSISIHTLNNINSNGIETETNYQVLWNENWLPTKIGFQQYCKLFMQTFHANFSCKLSMHVETSSAPPSLWSLCTTITLHHHHSDHSAPPKLVSNCYRVEIELKRKDRVEIELKMLSTQQEQLFKKGS